MMKNHHPTFILSINKSIRMFEALLLRNEQHGQENWTENFDVESRSFRSNVVHPFSSDLTMSHEHDMESNSTQHFLKFWRHIHSNNLSFGFSLTLFSGYAIVFLVALLANVFVVVMIIRRRRMRTLTNRFLLNLAISDLIATLICLPPTAYHYYDKRWIFGEFLCRFTPFMQGNLVLMNSTHECYCFFSSKSSGTSVAVSIFTLTAGKLITFQQSFISTLINCNFSLS